MSALSNIRNGLTSSGSSIIVGIIIFGLVATFGGFLGEGSVLSNNSILTVNGKSISQGEFAIEFGRIEEQLSQGDQDLSAKQKKIIEMCKKICEDEKNCKWCDVCSSIVNCSLNQTIKSKCREKKKEEKLKAAAKGTTKGGSKKKHSKKKHSKKKKKRIKKLTRKRQLNLNK